MREIIGEQCPDYLNSYDKVIKQCTLHHHHIKHIARSLFDSYCAWLFAILFELEKRVGEKQPEMSAFQSRFYGRVSEIIFNVWLDYQIQSGQISQKDVKELPFIYMEKINWFRKGFSFLKAKLFHKKYDSSF